MPKKIAININHNTAIRYLGSLFSLACVIFIFIRLKGYWDKIQITQLNEKLLYAIVILSLAYGMANVLLALSWNYLLRAFKVTSELKTSIKIYGISQLGKYIPGNIFQFAGKQALAMKNGLPTKNTLKANAAELVILLISGILLSLIIPLVMSTHISVNLILLLWLVTIATFLWLTHKYFNDLLVKAFLSQLTFLVLSASFFSLLLYFVIQPVDLTLRIILFTATAYNLSWLVGLVTPGAPAGIGVREFVVLFFLSPVYPESQLLLIVLLGRVVTTLGDLLFFFSCGLLKTNKI